MRRIMAKILVLGSHAESLIIFRLDMLIAMSKQHEVIACAPDASAAVIQKLKNAGVSFVPVKLARTGLNPIADLQTLCDLYKVFKKVRPDQVFLYTGKPVIYGSIAAKVAGIKQIYSMITGIGSYFVHTDLKSRIVRAIMSALYKVALSFNTKVFFQNLDDVADFAASGIFNNSSKTIITNGSGVNLEYFTQLPLPTNKIAFILTARFILAKGVIEYLTAAQQIKERYPHVEFFLVGWYENKDESIQPAVIQKYIDQGIIQYLGKLEDVRPALAQSSVFVLPSYREGIPKTILEAMACGRAIISTNVPGCKETVKIGVNGFLVPARDIASLRVAMEEFIIKPELIAQMGQRSREIAVEKYDVNQVNSVILNAMVESAV